MPIATTRNERIQNFQVTLVYAIKNFHPIGGHIAMGYSESDIDALLDETPREEIKAAFKSMFTFNRMTEEWRRRFREEHLAKPKANEVSSIFGELKLIDSFVLDRFGIRTKLFRYLQEKLQFDSQDWEEILLLKDDHGSKLLSVLIQEIFINYHLDSKEHRTGFAAIFSDSRDPTLFLTNSCSLLKTLLSLCPASEAVMNCFCQVFQDGMQEFPPAVIGPVYEALARVAMENYGQEPATFQHPDPLTPEEKELIIRDATKLPLIPMICSCGVRFNKFAGLVAEANITTRASHWLLGEERPPQAGDPLNSTLLQACIMEKSLDMYRKATTHLLESRAEMITHVRLAIHSHMNQPT